MRERELARRFRGLLPIVVDVETTGLDPQKHAIVEIAMVKIAVNEAGKLFPEMTQAYHVEPFAAAEINPESLQITGIDLSQPLRYAIPEQQALHQIFTTVRQWLTLADSRRAILVGHNAWFDLHFIQAAAKRCQLPENPFHSFTTIDTASVSAVLLGETVLARACKKAGVTFDIDQAHSAIYDAERTAELFCYLSNR